MSQAADEEPRHAFERDLVQALTSLSFMDTLDNRRLFCVKLSDMVGKGFDVDESPGSRMHVIRIVDECMRHRDGLRCLTSVLELFAPEQRGTVEAARLVRSFSAHEVMPESRQHTVLGLLDEADKLCIADVETLWYAAADELTPLPAGDVATLKDAFRHLSLFNARPDGLPPTLAFVEYVASRIRGDLAGELRDWADAEANRVGIGPSLNALRDEAVGAALPQRAPICLVVQIAEHGLLPDTFIMSHWTQHRPGPWHPERGEDQIVTLSDAETAVEEALWRAESAWGTRPGHPILEFILPAKLLNLPVEWWNADTVPFCVNYPITIRSLERMRTPKWHRFWRNRWSVMESSISLKACRTPESETETQQWNTRLHSDESISAVIMNNPPASSSKSADNYLWMALAAGVPVILWDHREECQRDIEIITSLAGGSPKALARRVKEMRTEAANLRAANHTSHHPGNHVTILWDNPDRLVDSQPYQSQGKISRI